MVKVSKKVKQWIDDWQTGSNRGPLYLGFGSAWLIPSSEVGAFYIVFASRGLKLWACSCRGFRFQGRKDGCCSHVDQAFDDSLHRKLGTK